jgi:hypothetical protein
MKRLLATILLLLGIFIAGCNSPQVMDYGVLVERLREAGATVEEVGKTELPGAGEPIFSVTSKIIKVNGENVQVLEYGDEATAETEAKFISPDGFDLRRPPNQENEGFAAHVDWIAPPHWSQKGRIIVLYVGKSQAIIDLLEDLLGKQFAGG